MFSFLSFIVFSSFLKVLACLERCRRPFPAVWHRSGPYGSPWSRVMTFWLIKHLFVQFFLFLRPWLKEFVIFDRKFGFLVNNCIYIYIYIYIYIERERERERELAGHVYRSMVDKSDFHWFLLEHVAGKMMKNCRKQNMPNTSLKLKKRKLQINQSEVPRLPFRFRLFAGDCRVTEDRASGTQTQSGCIRRLQMQSFHVQSRHCRKN